MMQQQIKLMEAITTKPSLSAQPPSTVPQSVDHTISSITEFLFDPVANVTFDSWYKRYEDLFNVDLSEQDDAWKVRLLLQKLGPVEHERYTNFILPKNPKDVSFVDTVNTLTQIFGEQSSRLNTRYQCLQLCKRDSDDFITYASIVNREYSRFQLSSLTEDQFKYLWSSVAGRCRHSNPPPDQISTRSKNHISDACWRMSKCSEPQTWRCHDPACRSPASQHQYHPNY